MAQIMKTMFLYNPYLSMKSITINFVTCYLYLATFIIDIYLFKLHTRFKRSIFKIICHYTIYVLLTCLNTSLFIWTTVNHFDLWNEYVMSKQVISCSPKQYYTGIVHTYLATLSAPASYLECTSHSVYIRMYMMVACLQ